MKEPRSLLDVAPVLPTVSVRDTGAATAVQVARAIARTGLTLIQVSLDAPAALDAIERIATEAPEVIVGAAEVNHVDQPALARAAGAEFLTATAPGGELRAALRDTELPHLPGVTSTQDAMELLDDGYCDMYLHPAAAAGGLRHLKALAAFVPAARFCAAGGIGAADLSGYLAAPNVGCVSADWLAPSDAVARRDWERIRRLADVALTLSKPTVTAVRAL
ncbi:2-keto-3-deoxy-6-phosphogluconate aldolase [Mycolicibacterium chubuense NBB4]|uniref:2-keto-3-deoxy-6-phosphogluconate aldolase n=1 Tax=Mycolicibacterium chubuense (strain NBB4) TaxID=710421 RepID=I4BNZ1_MYCCN|nr:ketohydroxyglutarate aldolase [Mycolicibacterium chubuense]AFM18998.1 2-keto-3-deoxy-6-phosphogluconate aldolase [Mycolicibacterium chubuense NBB4]